jgi:hypothetical protein
VLAFRAFHHARLIVDRAELRIPAPSTRIKSNIAAKGNVPAKYFTMAFSS